MFSLERFIDSIRRQFGEDFENDNVFSFIFSIIGLIVMAVVLCILLVTYLKAYGLLIIGGVLLIPAIRKIIRAFKDAR